MTIQQKQCLLCYLGLYNGAIDGIWGPKSANAEAQFRQNQGLSPTEALESALLDAIRPEENHWWDAVPHFRKEEFACKCGQFCDGYPAEPDKILVEAAEKVRNHFASPVLISSGLRCQTHNKNVGGAAKSRHLSGKAMDFRVQSRNAQEVLSFVKTLPEIRYCYAINSQYVHMDVD